MTSFEPAPENELGTSVSPMNVRLTNSSAVAPLLTATSLVPAPLYEFGVSVSR
jgi:hypothetical protein